MPCWARKWGTAMPIATRPITPKTPILNPNRAKPMGRLIAIKLPKATSRMIMAATRPAASPIPVSVTSLP